MKHITWGRECGCVEVTGKVVFPCLKHQSLFDLQRHFEPASSDDKRGHVLEESQ